MRRLVKAAGIAVAVVVGVVLALPLVVVAGLNTGPGQAELGRLVGWATGGQVQLRGLGGRFPDRLRIARLEVHDAGGLWLSIDNAVLDWHPMALLGRRANVGLLAADAVTVARLPQASGPSTPSSEPASLPLPVQLDRLQVARLDLGAPVAGVAASLALNGAATLETLAEGQVDLSVRRLDGPGTYHLAGKVDGQRLSADLTGNEPPKGLVSSLAGLPDLGALSVAAKLDGPWNQAALQLRLAGGELRATADGTLDLNAQAADLKITANAPAMKPRPDVSWQSVAVDAHVTGSVAAPTGTGTVRIAALEAAGASVRQIAIDLTADRGAADLRAVLTALSLPGVTQFADAPVVLAAHADLGRAEITGTLAHSLLDSAFTLRRDGVSNVTLTVPEMKPFAPLVGVALAGRAVLEAALTNRDGTSTADATLRLALADAPPPALAVLGPTPDVAVGATLHGSDLTLRSLRVNGRSLALDASGSLVANVLASRFALDLRDVAAAAPTLAGALKVQGSASGPLDRLAAQADITGTLGLRGTEPAPLSAVLKAENLPSAPTGSVTVQGALGGDRLSLAATGARDADGAMRLDITQGDWKSAHVAAKLAMTAGATLPSGTASLRMGDLGELAPLIGQKLTGSLDASAVFDPAEANVTVRGERLGLPGTGSAARLNLTTRLRDPQRPVVEARLLVDGIAASGATGASVRLDADGGLDALALKLDATGPGIRTTMAAKLDVPGSRLAISAFDGAWHDEHLVLAAPATLTFADAVAVDRLRLRLREATLDIAGRMFPTLDLTVALRDLPASLATLAAPSLAMAGSLRADARLTGKPAAPDGSVRLEATGLKMTSGPGASLPAAQVSANAKLGGGTTTLDANASVGTSRLGLSGTIVQNTTLNLRSTGDIDLTLLDPLLSPDGRRARGRIALDAGITGKTTDPRVAGSLTLARGEVQDLGQGIRISDIAARITGQGDRVVLESLTGKAGAGTITARGTVGLAGAMPLELSLTARNASPIQSELIRTAIDADLAVAGDLSGDKRASGTIRLRRTEIRIPEKLPAQVAVLNISRPKQGAPPAPLPPAPEIALDIAIEAPGQLFVRGRGLNAELGGSLRIRGSAAQPKPEGSFKLRRGDFSLVGKTLTFTQGAVGFDGHVPIDPTLDFQASSSNSTVTATLAIGGYASQPKITLSSVPTLPQDEVLAQLLFSKSATALGPIELAQIAAALAQIAGVGAGSGGTLDAIRGKLGLDRLAVGGNGANGATVEAGRTVAEGVYVGARQSTSGTGTQATVEIDITKGLKLQADIGQSSGSSATGASGGGGTGVGLKYEFEY
jgi:translocation and assembly module TamB